MKNENFSKIKIYGISVKEATLAEKVTYGEYIEKIVLDFKKSA